MLNAPAEPPMRLTVNVTAPWASVPMKPSFVNWTEPGEAPTTVGFAPANPARRLLMDFASSAERLDGSGSRKPQGRAVPSGGAHISSGLEKRKIFAVELVK